MICLTLKPGQKIFQTNWSFFVYRIQSKENLFTEKELFKEKGEWKLYLCYYYCMVAPLEPKWNIWGKKVRWE